MGSAARVSAFGKLRPVLGRVVRLDTSEVALFPLRRCFDGKTTTWSRIEYVPTATKALVLDRLGTIEEPVFLLSAPSSGSMANDWRSSRSNYELAEKGESNSVGSTTDLCCMGVFTGDTAKARHGEAAPIKDSSDRRRRTQSSNNPF